MPNRIIRSTLALGIALALSSVSVVSSSAADSPSGKKVRIVLVGDSTVSDSSGWGPGFKELLTDRAECFNVAANGRSTMSFMKEGRWTNALALKGDYYLIQFGHNNEPGKPGRSTDMPTFVNDMSRYAEDAQAIGAKPILVTPLTRRQWDKSDPEKIKSSLAPYAEEVKKIAAEKKVPVIDLHARSIETCEKLGREGCLAFSPAKVVDGTNTVDNTHLDKKGSEIFGRIVAQELVKAVPGLKDCFALDQKPRPGAQR